MSILDKQIVVKLNANWQGFQLMTVKDALVFLCSESGGEKPGYAMDYDTTVDDAGNVVFASSPVPVSWEDWVQLPVRGCDLAIGIGPDPVTNEPRSIRAPLVVICSRYRKIPMKTARWSPDAVRRRDKDICQVSKRKLAPGEGNTGHIVARSKGGADSFHNTIYMDRKLNTIQGTRTPEEMGWVVPKPKAPPTMPSILRAEDARHPSQKPFLIG